MGDSVILITRKKEMLENFIVHPFITSVYQKLYTDPQKYNSQNNLCDLRPFALYFSSTDF